MEEVEEEGVGATRKDEGVAGEGLLIGNLEEGEGEEGGEVEGEARVILKVVEDGEVVSRVEGRDILFVEAHTAHCV